MDQKTLDTNFTYHAPTATQADIYVDIRQTAKGFAELLNTVCPEGREKSSALTKLEESVFWANAAIARNAINTLLTPSDTASARSMSGTVSTG